MVQLELDLVQLELKLVQLGLELVQLELLQGCGDLLTQHEGCLKIGWNKYPSQLAYRVAFFSAPPHYPVADQRQMIQII